MINPHDLISQMNEIISSQNLSMDEKRIALWELTSRLWDAHFPTGMTSSERKSKWSEILNDCTPEKYANYQRILDVLRWPAVGEDPVWLLSE